MVLVVQDDAPPWSLCTEAVEVDSMLEDGFQKRMVQERMETKAQDFPVV